MTGKGEPWHTKEEHEREITGMHDVIDICVDNSTP